ncbi:MAG: hypothetical protein HYX95_02440 [Chloroflexi bacterium]|nr:hypothetical protein [Chloroflexota bacterium]
MDRLRDTLHGLGIAIKPHDIWEYARSAMQERAMTREELEVCLMSRFRRLRRHEAYMVAETLLEMVAECEAKADGAPPES